MSTTPSSANPSSSSSNPIPLQGVAPPPEDTLPLPPSARDYPQYVTQGSSGRSSEFKHAQDYASPPVTAGAAIRVGGGGAGGGVSGLNGKGRKSNFSEILPQQQYHNAQDSRSFGPLQIHIEPALPPGLGHGSGIVSQQSSTSSTIAEGFRTLMGSQDDSSLQPTEQQGLGAVTGLRYSVATDANSAASGSIGAAARSLSHPNLSSIAPSSRTLPPVAPGQGPLRLVGGSGGSNNPQPPSTSVQQPSHSQAPIPFPTNLGGFTLSSMVGHFTSHPQLQPQSLAVNPAGGLMPGLGLSVGSNQNQPPSLSMSNPQMLGGAPNSSISIMNPQTSLSGVSNRQQNSPQAAAATSIPMPLTHPIAGNLQNPAGLPLLPGMPNMYSYPYAAGALPTQPAATTSVVHVNAPPGFPSQSLMQGYSQYLPPSLYGNAPQQPPPLGDNR